MNTRIFCAIDYQEHSGWAADAAIDISRAMSSKLIFFMANPVVMPSWGPIVYCWTSESINSLLNQAKQRSRNAGVHEIDCLTRETADVAKSILEESRLAGATYIVMGSDFRSGTFCGWRHSISRKVVEGAHCPTLVVHQNVANQDISSIQTLGAE
jgi:nucleotide-binding universal stress UspA family protein